ncbi:MAG: hypothetical protein RSB91_03995 [Clostridia bacterium]
MTVERMETTQVYRDDICELKQTLCRVDEIHREVTRAAGRIKWLQLSAERANSRLTPVYYGRGVEHSRVEQGVLESEAERWGIVQLKQELQALLETVRPLVERLPPGLLRAIATQRYLDGVPCGVIAKRMCYSRCYIYRLLETATDRLCEMDGSRPPPHQKM